MIGAALLLPAYRLVSRAFAPFAPAFLRRRLARGKEDGPRLGERLGLAGRPRPEGRLAWLHGASVGEGLALMPIMPKLIEHGMTVVVTSGTVTSATVLRDRLPSGAFHQFVPLDVPKFVRRFLSHWRPDIVIIAESELWPNLILETHRRGLPIVLLNARMSERSLRGWRRALPFVGRLLGCIDLCLAQTDADARRFLELGAPDVRVTGNLKYDASPPGANREEVALLLARIGSRHVWVAASTHPGEEDLVAEAHARIARQFPDLLTIIAPRHPERGREVAAVMEAKGLPVVLRSRKQPPLAATQVYVADTIGDLGLFYRLAGIVFLGKSLAGGGGQNPVEPAKLNCAILHGPLVQNFEEVYAALDATGGAVAVADVDALAATLTALFSDTARLRATARAAAETIESLSGAADRVMEALRPVFARLPPDRSG